MEAAASLEAGAEAEAPQAARDTAMQPATARAANFFMISFSFFLQWIFSGRGRGAGPVDSYYNTRVQGKKQGEISPTKGGNFHRLGHFSQSEPAFFVQKAHKK